MAVSRSVRWAVGVGLLVLLSLTPSTCVRIVRDKVAAGAAVKVEAAQAEAAEFLRQRDSAFAVAIAAEARAAQVKERLVYVRQAVPPTPPPVPGCERCEERARALEAVIVTQDSVIEAQDGAIAALHETVRLGALEAATLRSGLSEAHAALARLAAPRPVVRTSFLRKILPTAQVGYGGVISDGGLHHGPGVLLGWRIAL